jgi:hypothetical protein
MAAPATHTSSPLCRIVSSSDAWPSSTIRRMKASSVGSRSQPSASAHQSASGCGAAESNVTWKS